MSTNGPAPLPHLRTTRENAARKIADAIRDYEQLRSTVRARPIPELQDDLDIQRRHTIELLRSLFNQPTPADEFDNETVRSVFYTNPPEEEQRRDLDTDIRQCITQLRSLTARLDFYQPPTEQPSENTTPRVPTAQPATQPPPITPEPAPSLPAIIIFLAVLLGTAGLIIWQRQEIAQLTGPATAVFYLIISLVPAILLFGLFRAVAKASGKLYGLTIELGGPAALFIIVLLILTNLPASKPESPITKPGTDTTDTTLTTTTSTRQPPTTPQPVPAPQPRPWRTVITAHGVPDQNSNGWLDGRYTAYIMDKPNGAITSDPVSTASHAGYVVVAPHQGRYRITIRYAAITDRPVNVFTAPDVPHNNGEDIFGKSKTQLAFPTTASPVIAEKAPGFELDLQQGRNVIDLRSASPAGLPDLFSLTIEAVATRTGADDL
ncbi:MAG: hypothetical protein JO197_15575 [Acidobacteria bacterium]|nr:hypothetical protein [Acidobacteriota bacterium]MBV9475057.1 hypothetical protein [Acidobacteriota bacterium]